MYVNPFLMRCLYWNIVRKVVPDAFQIKRSFTDVLRARTGHNLWRKLSCSRTYMAWNIAHSIITVQNTENMKYVRCGSSPINVFCAVKSLIVFFFCFFFLGFPLCKKVVMCVGCWFRNGTVIWISRWVGLSHSTRSLSSVGRPPRLWESLRAVVIKNKVYWRTATV